MAPHRDVQPAGSRDGLRPRQRCRRDSGGGPVKRLRRLAAAASLALVAIPVAASAQEVAELPAMAPLPAWMVPYHVSIPRLGTGSWIVPLALEDDGAMASPTDPDTVGWYEL